MIGLGPTCALSEREQEVLLLAADGLTDKEIAKRLEIGAKTVRTYWDRMRAKLSASSRTQCLAMALREAYESIAQSEKGLRTFFQHMPVLFNSFDEHMNVTNANQEWERLTGHPMGALVGSPKFLEVIYPDPAVRQDALRRLAANWGWYHDLETDITCADGSTRTIAWSSKARQFPLPNRASWHIGVDVTERRKAERERAAAEARYRELLETCTQGVWMVDAEQRTTFANQKLADMLGMEREEILGKSICEFDCEFEPGVLSDLVANASSGSPVSFTFRLIRKDGQDLWAAVDLTPLFDSDGNLSGHSAVLQDITANKQMERQLADLTDSYERLVRETKIDANVISPTVLGQLEMVAERRRK